MYIRVIPVLFFCFIEVSLKSMQEKQQYSCFCYILFFQSALINYQANAIFFKHWP